MPGVGKTTVGDLVCRELISKGRDVVHVDGDEVRKLWTGLGYSKKDRLLNAERICQYALEFYNDGKDVVCSTVSLYHSIHKLYRILFDRYFEVLLISPLSELKIRKPLIYEVLDFSFFEFPKSPHLILDNCTQEESCQKVIDYVGL